MNETKTNYDLLEKARVMIFAGDGWPVEAKIGDPFGSWAVATHPCWDFQAYDYRIAPDALKVPEGYELAPLGKSTAECIILRPYSEWEEYDGSTNRSPSQFIARKIGKPEPRKVPLTKEDWDGHPVWWVRLNVGFKEFLVSAISDAEIYYNEEWCLTASMMKHERSHNRITWAPCWKKES